MQTVSSSARAVAMRGTSEMMEISPMMESAPRTPRSWVTPSLMRLTRTRPDLTT